MTGPMMTKAEGDRIAVMVLRIVEEVGRQTGRTIRTRRAALPEPTGIRVDPDMEDAVMRRSA